MQLKKHAKHLERMQVAAAGDLRDELTQMMEDLDATLYIGKGGQKEVARNLGITTQGISNILHGRCDPSEQVAKRMGWVRTVVYLREEA